MLVSIANAGLLFVTAKINGRLVRVFIDSGASHIFCTREKAKGLGLKTEVINTKTLKTVNCPSKDIVQVAKDIHIQVGNVKSTLDISVVPMDNFEIVFGQTWLRANRCLINLHDEQLVFLKNEGWELVKASRGNLAAVQVLSAMRMRKAVNTLTFRGSMLPSPKKRQADRERNLLGR